MKAILVIDLPKNCAECKLESICNEVDWEERPSSCPLKPMPQKKNTSKIQGFGYSQIMWTNKTIHQNEGWNDCIDEIAGGMNGKEKLL